MAYYKCGTIHPTQNSNVVIDTTSGSIANFETPLAMPLLDAQIDVNAVQDLHGQSGAYPAGGGIQKWDEEWELGGIGSSTGSTTPDTDRIRSKNFCSCAPSTTYYFVIPSKNVSIYFYDANYEFISYEGWWNSSRTFTTPSNCQYFKIGGSSAYGTTYKNDISINYPSTDTAYHPYSNICPIEGWDEISVHNLGGNFFNKNTVTNGYLINASGNEVSYADWNISDYIPVVEGASYYFYGITTHPNTNQDNFELFDENKNKVGYANVKTNEQPYVIPSGVAYIKCSVKNPDLDTTQFGVYVNDSFVPYNPVIEGAVIQLNNTYYGGRFIQDKSGKRKFEVTHKIYTFSGSETWILYEQANSFFYFSTEEIDEVSSLTLKGQTENGIVSKLYNGSTKRVIRCYFNDNPILTTETNMNNIFASGQKIVYELAEPIIIDLPDGTPFKSLPGVNNFFADTGDTAVKFRKIGE